MSAVLIFNIIPKIKCSVLSDIALSFFVAEVKHLNLALIENRNKLN